jgi:hypothetical protein
MAVLYGRTGRLTDLFGVSWPGQWWNPAVEYQAMDRIHRIGQFRPIEVVRFFIADSIEDRILRLQVPAPPARPPARPPAGVWWLIARHSW